MIGIGNGYEDINIRKCGVHMLHDFSHNICAYCDRCAYTERANRIYGFHGLFEIFLNGNDFPGAF